MMIMMRMMTLASGRARCEAAACVLRHRVGAGWRGAGGGSSDGKIALSISSAKRVQAAQFVI